MSLPVDLLLRNGGSVRNLKNEPDLNLNMVVGQHGPDELTFQLCNWAKKLPNLGSLVSLRHATYGYFWSGYCEQPAIDMFGPTQITAHGWWHTAQNRGWDTQRVFAAGTPLDILVKEAITKCQHISGGIPLPGGLTTTQLPDDSQDFGNQTPEEVFDYVKNLFTYLGTPLVWNVRQSPDHPKNEDPCLEMKFVDSTPRLRVRLSKEDKFVSSYAYSAQWNEVILKYANGLYETEQAAQPYTVIPDLKAKRVNADNDVTGTLQAQALAAYLIARGNTLRPVNTTLELDCDTKVEAVYDASPSLKSNWPHYLIRPHYTIRILNSFANWGPYNIRDFYIVEVRYDFTSGKTSLVLGDPILYDTFKLLQSYETNRASAGIESAIVSEPLHNADELPVYGPTADGTTVPSVTGAGVPTFYLDKAGTLVSITDPNKPALPNGAALHPNIIPDYGVQANFGREASQVGIKGFIQVVPCTVLAWDVCHTPPAGSNTIPTDAMEIWLHNTYPFTAGNTGTRIAQVIISSPNACASGNLGTPAVFAQRGKIGVEVRTPSAVAGSGFQLSVTGKKYYPDLT